MADTDFELVHVMATDKWGCFYLPILNVHRNGAELIIHVALPAKEVEHGSTGSNRASYPKV